jgi:hypothetical protein
MIVPGWIVLGFILMFFQRREDLVQGSKKAHR